MLDKKLILNLQFGYRSYVKKPMEKLKNLRWLYSKCLDGEELTKNECSLIYSLCFCKSTKEFPIDDLASFVFKNEKKVYTSQKEYRSLFILVFTIFGDYEIV